MGKGLTPKQEEFSLEYIRNGENASDAYRHAYNTENMQDATIWTEACLLLGSHKVSKRIEELRATIAERALCTLDELNDELTYARDLAKTADDYRELRASAMDRGKLHGLITDKQQVSGGGAIIIVPRSFKDNEDKPSS